jgi:hypothetical protein
MATSKTVPTDASVSDFLAAMADERRRRDAHRVCELMTMIRERSRVVCGTGSVGAQL